MLKKIGYVFYHKKIREDKVTHSILGIKITHNINKKKKIKILEKRISFLEDYTFNLPYEIASSQINVPKVMNQDETLDTLLHSEKSICRFGDGELMIMLNKGGPKFQPYSKELSDKLKECIQTKEQNILIALTNRFGCLDDFENESKNYWRHFLRNYRQEIYQYLDFDKTYYDAAVTRPYRASVNQEKSAVFFQKIKKLWQNKNIVIVEGEKTRMGVGNDLLDNAKSIKRILCPATDSFSKYDLIFNECCKQSKQSLFLIALGPTATVLAYQLALKGYRALDIGHLDIEYEWMIRNSGNEKVKVPGKYVNEVSGGDIVSECCDENYISQIIANIN